MRRLSYLLIANSPASRAPTRSHFERRQSRQDKGQAKQARAGEVVSGRGGPPFVQSEVRAGWGIRPGDGALVVGARTRAPFVQSQGRRGGHLAGGWRAAGPSHMRKSGEEPRPWGGGGSCCCCGWARARAAAAPSCCL